MTTNQLNYQSNLIAKRNSEINQRNSEINAKNAETNAKNAESNRLSAQAQVSQAETAKRNQRKSESTWGWNNLFSLAGNVIGGLIGW